MGWRAREGRRAELRRLSRPGASAWPHTRGRNAVATGEREGLFSIRARAYSLKNEKRRASRIRFERLSPKRPSIEHHGRGVAVRAVRRSAERDETERKADRSLRYARPGGSAFARVDVGNRYTDERTRVPGLTGEDWKERTSPTPLSTGGCPVTPGRENDLDRRGRTTAVCPMNGSPAVRSRQAWSGQTVHGTTRPGPRGAGRKDSGDFSRSSS